MTPEEKAREMRVAVEHLLSDTFTDKQQKRIDLVFALGLREWGEERCTKCSRISFPKSLIAEEKDGD
jgi:hypothetical protein